MKLDGKSVAWTVVAAVLTVWTWCLLDSLASDARAMFLGIVAGVVIVCAVAYLFFHRPRDINDEYAEFVREEQGDPDYVPAQQPPAVQPVVQEVHYHYHAAQGQQPPAESAINRRGGLA